MTKILSVGHSVLDLIFHVDKLPQHDGKFLVDDFISVGGGPAANAAVTIAKLGAKSYFAGRVGNDHYGQTVIDELQDYGVHCDYVTKIDQAATSLSAVIVDNDGNRQIMNYKSSKLDDYIEHLKSINWQQFDAILVDVRWLQGAKYALKQAKKYNIPTILDADVSERNAKDLVQLASYSIFSEPGLYQLMNMYDPKEALSKAKEEFTGELSVTLGAKGFLYFEHGKMKKYDAINVKALDTTGAGDVFHGAFAYHIAKYKKNMKEALIFSAHVAALKCTRLGGRKGIPSIGEVLEFIQA